MRQSLYNPHRLTGYKQGKCDGKGSAELNKVGPREDFIMVIHLVKCVAYKVIIIKCDVLA